MKILGHLFEKRFSDKFTIQIDSMISHKQCGSLGIHIDFKNKYITLHFLWFFILIGNDSKSRAPKQFLIDSQNLRKEYKQKQIDLYKKYGIDIITH